MSDSKNNYIDLLNNGRLFPIWVMHNFKKYKLSPLVYSDKIDPCNVKEENYNELTNYQKFLASYLDYRSIYKDILIYHGLGSGKTATAINIYNMLYNYTPDWNIFILIKASLKNDPWLKDLNRWISSEDKNQRIANIYFIHYDAPNADKAFINTIKEVDANKKTMYIIDEVHNFIKNVYNNIVSGIGRRAFVIYDYIITEKKENSSTRVVLLSATPVVNTPYELALIFNLLRPDIFPKKESLFNEKYISKIGNRDAINPDAINMFQRRILGLVSYYIGTDPKKFAKKNTIMKFIVMDKFQQLIYEMFERIEENIERRRVGPSSSTVYRSYTRQACNFVFPDMDNNMRGDTRPRPNKFRLTIKDEEALLRGAPNEIIKDNKDKAVDLYLKEINKFLSAFDNYLSKFDNSIKKDVEIFKTKYNMSFSKFWKEYNEKSLILKKMYECSCKMIAMLFYMIKSKGPILVYSNYLRMEGIQIFKIYMKYFGYTDYTKNSSGEDFYRYTEFHGEIDTEQRSKNLKNFNDESNLFGKNIKVILISPAGAEGINLQNIRQIHIMEPYWNDVRIEQVIGRGVRMCSHKLLAFDERIVDIYRYHAIRLNRKPTTDEEIQELAADKSKLNNIFLKLIKEAAVDCNLFKNHNMLEEKYTCFQFNQESVFEKHIGSAYKQDIYYDTKINNGLNSVNSIKRRVKVIKIQATIKNKKEINTYWYDPDSNIIYDYDLDYPIGKILIENNVPVKIDENIYVIEDVIPIPKLTRV
jgi:superfamily II DNA or RNA helicase